MLIVLLSTTLETFGQIPPQNANKGSTINVYLSQRDNFARMHFRCRQEGVVTQREINCFYMARTDFCLILAPFNCN